MQNREIIQIVISGTDTDKIYQFIKNIDLKSDDIYEYYLPESDNNPNPAIIDLHILDIEFFNITKQSDPEYAFNLCNTIKDATAIICMDSSKEVESTLGPLLPDCLFIDYDDLEMTASECLIHIGQGVNEELVSAAYNKAKILCESYQTSDSIFSALPKEINSTIAQLYFQSEFKKDPFSFLFFTSERNYKPKTSEHNQDLNCLRTSP